jgi:uncharacterized membrane protein YesL
MDFVNAASTFILLNMLWLFCSVLLVTLPAATAALFAVLAPWARGQSPSQPLANFFVAIRRYWLKATAVALIDLVLGALVIFNFLVLRQMGIEQIPVVISLTVTVILAVLLVLSNIYVWPLLITLDLPLRLLLKNSLKLGVAHPFWAFLVTIMAVLPFGVSLILPRFFFLTVTFATSTLIINWGAWRIIRRYLDETEIEKLGV